MEKTKIVEVEIGSYSREELKNMIQKYFNEGYEIQNSSVEFYCGGAEVVYVFVKTEKKEIIEKDKDTLDFYVGEWLHCCTERDNGSSVSKSFAYENYFTYMKYNGYEPLLKEQTFHKNMKGYGYYSSRKKVKKIESEGYINLPPRYDNLKITQ